MVNDRSCHLAQKYRRGLAMKAFEFSHKIIESYTRFSRSFSSIRSDDLKAEIDRQYDEGRFWPDALLSINPRFLKGATADELVASGDLDEATGKIFRFGSTPLRFHRHQAQAIAKARAGKSYVVTTGTGSGKSLCFFVPVVASIVRARKAGKPRKTSAIIVYPMNALANSQMNEIEKFISQSGLPNESRPVVRRYTGQESQEERQQIADNPPDILLTNFMMAIGVVRAPTWPFSSAAFAIAAHQTRRRSASAHQLPWRARVQTPIEPKPWQMLPPAFSESPSGRILSSMNLWSARRMTG